MNQTRLAGTLAATLLLTASSQVYADEPRADGVPDAGVYDADVAIAGGVLASTGLAMTTLGSLTYVFGGICSAPLSDGLGSSCEDARIRSHLGLASMVAGGSAMLAGIAMISFGARPVDEDTVSLQIDLAPTGFALRGSF